MIPSRTTYHGFLLRMWGQSDGSTRASITDVETGELRVFPDIEGLCRWLRHIDRIDRASPVSTSPPGGPS